MRERRAPKRDGRARKRENPIGAPKSRTGKIEVAWSVPRGILHDRDVRTAVRAALRHGGREQLEVDVALVSDEELASIHERFLDDPSPTDVISFDLGEGGGGPAGEVYVSVDRAIEVARKRGVPASDELRLSLVHGALHLCGYDDREPGDRARMRRAESAVLGALGRANAPRDGTRGSSPHEKTGKRSRR